jgi:hypothetical protein
VGFLKSSNNEIKKMNQGKVGAPFEYSHSYIHFLASLKIGFKIAYRTVQGITRGLSDYIRIEEMHFTHIRRWILNIKPSVRITRGNIHDTKKVRSAGNGISWKIYYKIIVIAILYCDYTRPYRN